MIIIPAIDLKKSKVVRLYKGKFEQATSYGLDPVDLVKDYILKGARRIHIVSLLGAKEGKILEHDYNVIREMLKMKNLVAGEKCEIQLGGGIRRSHEIKQFFEAGVDYVILGTAIVLPQILEANFSLSDIARAYALADKKFEPVKEIPEPDLMDKINKETKKRIIVSIDVFKNSVALSGWLVTIPVEPSWIIKKLIEKDLTRFMITDTSRDGTLHGVDIEVFEKIIDAVGKFDNSNYELIIGGGIGSEKDVEIIANSGLPISGVVIGKAIYEKKLQIQTLIRKYQT